MVHYKMFVLGMGSFSLKERGGQTTAYHVPVPFLSFSRQQGERVLFYPTTLPPGTPGGEVWEGRGGGMEELPTYTPILKGRSDQLGRIPWPFHCMLWTNLMLGTGNI